MGLFDFPRIHFAGNVDVNVPTINNTYYFPLTIYDTTRVQPFLPPRLYFSTEALLKGVNSPFIPKCYHDEINDYVYIEIEPINTIEILRKWCMTPLGKYGLDSSYYPFYEAANKDLAPGQGVDIIGKCPGYWNMYGDMSVSMSETYVTGVQTFENDQVKTWTNSTKIVPIDVKPLLESRFDMDTKPGSGISTATMVETISSQSVYANVFCSNINLFNSQTNDVYLQGNPKRYSALIYSGWRVLNWFPPMAGSGRFCSSIALDDMPDADKSALINFFKSNNSYDGRVLKGVFVTFTIHEVYENRFDQDFYKNNGAVKDPAECTTVGSICPWYDGDMTSGVLGRNLIALYMDSVYNNTTQGSSIPVSLAPAISSLKVLATGSAIFSVDMGNTWPEKIDPPYSSTFQPAHRGEATFETFDLGTLIFRCADPNQTEIARIEINSTSNSRIKVFQTGCVFDFIITDLSLIQLINTNLISVYLDTGSEIKHVLQESEYMIATDQRGLYSNQGDLPDQGYYVNDENREPCRLRILQKGVPVHNPIKVFVAEYSVPEAANDPSGGPIKPVNSQMISDKGIVKLSDSSLQFNNNAIYYFVYDGQYKDNQIPVYSTGNYTIMDTGAFSCLRVLPTKDYSKYINPNDPNYTPPIWEVVYKEVFELYDVAYPAMALVHPFTKKQWENGTMAGLVVQRTHRSMWNNILYMPRSREMSDSQHELLVAWAKYVDEQSEQDNLIVKSEDIVANPSFSVELNELQGDHQIPYIQSCAYALFGSKLLIIGGRYEGFHGLAEDTKVFDSAKANDSIWVIDLLQFTSSEWKLDPNDPDLLQFSSSNMEFCQTNEVLYIVGGFGRKAISSKESDFTFDQIIAIDIAKMIAAVESGTDPKPSILDRAASPDLQVTGGELVFVKGIFYLMFGQKYTGSYSVGISGEYTDAVRSFTFENGRVTALNTTTDSINLHRRDLTVLPITQQNGGFHAAFGGVFTPSNNGFVNPVYLRTANGMTSIHADTLNQITNQYNCAHISMYDATTDTNYSILLGGIGRFMFNKSTRQWEDGDLGAKLPFVSAITHMKYQGGSMTQYVQTGPSSPEMPGFLGANAIFIPNSGLIFSKEIIDYNKIPLGRSSIGIMYGGIASPKSTSSGIYPSTFNGTIYEVFITKTT